MGYLVPHIRWEQKLAGTRLVDGEIWLGHISSAAAREITKPHGYMLLECYINPSILRSIAADTGMTPGEVLAKQILPDENSIKAGDFGEILARSIIIEREDHPCIPAFRWRNRAHKNDTIRGVDLLGYVMPSVKPSESDTLILCEVKTRSNSVRKQVVEDALNDAKKHYVSRLANSLYFIQAWLRQDGQNDEACRFARFANRHETPFCMELVPFVVHETRTWKDTFLDTLPVKYQSPAEYKKGETIDVRVMCVDNLAHWIDDVHRAAVECAG